MTTGTGLALAAMWLSMLGIVYLIPTLPMAITAMAAGAVVTLFK